MPETPDLSRLIDDVSNLVKEPSIQIVRYLLEHPGSFRGDILAGTSIPEGSIALYLRELVDTGAVTSDLRTEQRRGPGRAARYSADPVRIRQLIDAIRAELLG